MPDHLGKVQGPRAASIKAVWPSWFGTSTLLPVSTVRLLRGSSRAEPNASIPRAPRRSGWKRPRLSSAQVDELQALAALPDAAIDTSDVPEVLDWTGAKRGLFYRARQAAIDAPPGRRPDRLVQGPRHARRRLSNPHQPGLARLCARRDGKGCAGFMSGLTTVEASKLSPDQRSLGARPAATTPHATPPCIARSWLRASAPSIISIVLPSPYTATNEPKRGPFSWPSSTW